MGRAEPPSPTKCPVNVRNPEWRTCNQDGAVDTPPFRFSIETVKSHAPSNGWCSCAKALDENAITAINNFFIGLRFNRLHSRRNEMNKQPRK